MEKITIKDKQFVKYISSEVIEKAVREVAHKINADYYEKTPIMLVVLNGAIMFASDLLKNLNIDCEVSCIKVSSYEGMSSTEEVKTLIGLKSDIKGRDIIIVEDIVDTGNTIDALIKLLLPEQPTSIKIATMTYKAEAYKKTHKIDYVALSIPNKFIVGYGLDYDELGRNYKDIYQVTE
jgi:hypoxanthine phosphoribosyltransferase